MLRFTFCPALTWRSFTVIIVLIELVAFITANVVSIIKYNNISIDKFLGPLNDGMSFSEGFNTFGLVDLYPYGIKNNYQIWRLLTPVFFNTDFMTIVMNSILTLIYGSFLERAVGFKYTAATYFISNIGGIFLSLVATSDNISGLGPAPAI